VSAVPPDRERLTRDEGEPSAAAGLTVTLWSIAALIATLELVIWWAARIYS
jgi:hypothetical protein